MSGNYLTVGLISDTHGLLRPSAVEALQHSDLIVHAGDIDTPEVLHDLSAIAPVYPVRGNMDRNPVKGNLPTYDIVEAGEVSIYVIHDLYKMDLNPAAAGCEVVVYGHSHRPKINDKDDVLYINPGSAGPRRFTLPISVGMLKINGKKIMPRIINIAE